MKSIQQVIKKIKPVDIRLAQTIQAKLDSLTKPPGSLGRLEELAKTICLIHGRILPNIKNKKIIVFAADHGVAASGVSAYPQEVTQQMLHNFVSGGAAINVLSRYAGAEIQVVDIGVNSKSTPGGVLNKKIALGTRNMAEGEAMTEEQAIASLQVGLTLVEEICLKAKPDIIAFGEMGIGNTTAATAVLAAMTAAPVASITGKGTGLTEAARLKKVAVIEQALRKNKPNPNDALDILKKVGGFEIGGMAGAILAAAANQIPVLLDGLIAAAAALISWKFKPECASYLIASHQSSEPGHKKMLELLKLKPYLDFDMRLGEGTGAALLMSLAEGSLRILNEMATFDSAGVSGKNESIG